MRLLPKGLMVLGLMGIAVAGISGGNEGDKKELIAQGTATRKIAPPAPSINKVVIGVLDFETSGGWADGLYPKKNDLMRELRRNTRVKLVDIRESCSLSELKRNGYEKAERYKNSYQLDMILHLHMSCTYTYRGDGRSDFSLMDLYIKKIKKVSIETQGVSVDLAFRGISRKILVSQDLNRVLSAKKEVLGKKEVAVRPEIKEPPKREVMESPQEIEDFLIQNGPKLIAEDEYDRVLELIDDLPRRRSKHIQIQTLECFANLKGWVSDRDQSCKSRWWNVRQRLINSEDNEATPMLVILLKDENHYLRIYAAELLEHIGGKRALKELRAVGENDENRKVRKYAKRAGL